MIHRRYFVFGKWSLIAAAGVVLGGCGAEANPAGEERTSEATSALGACTPYSMFHLLGSAVSASPGGDYAASAGTTSQGFFPTHVLTPNGFIWYTDALTGTFNGGFYDLNLWTDHPGGSSPVFAQLGTAAIDGSAFSPIAVSGAVDVNATGTGNHVTTLAIHVLAPIALTNQRLVVKVFLQSGAGTTAPTIVYNGGDFDTNLQTAGGCATLTAPTCLSGALPRFDATASSTMTIVSSVASGGPPTDAIDGPHNAVWYSDPDGPQWLTVDLGAERYVNRLALVPQLTGALEIQGSTDGVTFSPLAEVAASAGGPGPAEVSGFEGRARYVRVLSPSGHMVLDDVAVFGDGEPGCASVNGEAKAIFSHDCGFGPPSVGLREGSYDLSALVSLGIKNDDISSVEVDEGYEVSLFQNAGFAGFQLEVTSDQACLAGVTTGRSDGRSWNDDVSSIEIAPQGGNTGGLRVFSDASFLGDSQRFGEGIYDAASGDFARIAPFSVSSLRVAAGFEVVVCSKDSSAGIDSGDLGLCRLYTAGDYAYVGADLNDRISLVAVATTETPSSGFALTAWTDANLGGSAQPFGLGIYQAQFGELGNLGNDTMSSLIVVSSVRVMACADDGFGGRTGAGSLGLCRLFGEGEHDFVGADLNDLTSLLIIEP